jgi:hypothetical protein
MKYKILLATTALCSTLLADAQKASRSAYAITGATKGSFAWTEVKQIDLGTGEVVQAIYDNQQSVYTVLQARSGKAISVKDEKGTVANTLQLPFATYSAACAYDKQHNRLYYTPMFINQLRYIDLDPKTPTINYFENEAFSAATDLNNEANHITRMAIAADGHGYGLSNDGNHLVKFTTGRKPIITDLGPVQDDPAGTSGISFHTKTTSWGGDMVADAMGNLYVVSAFRNVFKINISTRQASFVASLNDIPTSFTTNGAAVVDDDKLILSSANSVEGYYEVDMNTWKSTKLGNGGNVFNASDLANGNLAFEKSRQTTIPNFISRNVVANDKITVYPNPVVTRGAFRVSFRTGLTGNYAVQLVDISGRVISQKNVVVGYDGQVAEIPVAAEQAKGMYLVKVLGSGNKTVYADKLIIAD